MFSRPSGPRHHAPMSRPVIKVRLNRMGAAAPAAKRDMLFKLPVSNETRLMKKRKGKAMRLSVTASSNLPGTALNSLDRRQTTAGMMTSNNAGHKRRTGQNTDRKSCLNRKDSARQQGNEADEEEVRKGDAAQRHRQFELARHRLEFAGQKPDERWHDDFEQCREYKENGNEYG